MNAIVPKSFGQVASVFANAPAENDLGAGVQAGFGIVGYRGKVWSTRYRGEERQMLRDDGDGPRGSIEVVIIKSASVVSKVWYKDGWVEGSTSPPDCFSTNGQTPDMQAQNRQSNACASCPMNAWGSRITPSGKNGKQCSDSKRLAVLPLNDLSNDEFGGPMLLRVPAASLQDMATYGTKMQQAGYPYYAIGTRIAFDPKESYPKFVFSGIRVLDEAEARQVAAWQNDPLVARILSEGTELVAPQKEAAPTEQLFEQGPPTTKVTPASNPTPAEQPKDVQPKAAQAEPAKRTTTTRKAAAPAPAPEPVEEEATNQAIDDLDARLEGLIG